ncbi:hypothetical protein BJV93_004247 [Clostridium butyricum]|nr:hypothetical protein [Clostridium butyricum]
MIYDIRETKTEEGSYWIDEDEHSPLGDLIPIS